MKNRFGLIIGLITFVLIIGGVFLFSKSGSNSPQITPPSSYEYFWGDGCPHCANVQAFFDTWEEKDKVPIDKKEVWSNAANAKLMQERAKACNISPSGMGVPFLVTPEGKCLSGDIDIIEHFKSL